MKRPRCLLFNRPLSMGRSCDLAFTVFTAVIGGGFLTGCTQFLRGPDFDTDALVGDGIPAGWTASGAVSGQQAAGGWIDDFSSSELRLLVEEAVGSNFDLAATAARVRQSAARARVAGASLLPSVEADFSSSRSQRLRGAQFQTVRANQFDLGINLTWELDLWGRIANARRSALAELDASSADFHAARLALAADVVKTAFDLIAAQLEIGVASESLTSLQANLEILDRQLELGDAVDRTALDISLSRADVARAKADIVAAEREEDGARRRLETLLGRYPASALKTMNRLPTIRREVPPGLPSELLLRRPDLAAAEFRVDAALDDTAAARKALLPAFRITGSAGTSTTNELKDLLDINALVWNIAGGLTQPLFEGGRLRAELALAEAERDELALSYAEAALTAFREVETALASERFLSAQETELQTAVSESERAEKLALGQYEKGLVDIITVLESQRRVFDTRSTLLNITKLRLQNRVDLYLALGGDFDTPPR